jgi:predicted CXXCH cytochrome family protein
MVVCLAVLLLLTRLASADTITITNPPAQSIYYARSPYIHLVIKLTNRSDLSRLKLEAQNEKIMPVGEWQKDSITYVHFRLFLKPGKNAFEINPGAKNISVNYRPLRSLLNVNIDAPSVFMFHKKEVVPAECGLCHTEELPADSKIEKPLYGAFSPLCFSCHKEITAKSTWKHSPVVNVLCETCHKPDPKVDSIILPLGKVDVLCFRCHVNQKNWKTMAHVHGPAGTGDCTVCHNPHGDQFQGQLWAAGDKELCIACHTDKKKLIYEIKGLYVHGILTGSGCTACHSPHATPYRFQLFKPIYELCTSCHTKLAGVERGHPVDKHPVRGGKDPRRAGHEFSCTSCHNPHGSRYKFMLVGDVIGEQVCVDCHSKKKTALAPEK